MSSEESIEDLEKKLKKLEQQKKEKDFEKLEAEKEQDLLIKIKSLELDLKIINEKLDELEGNSKKKINKSLKKEFNENPPINEGVQTAKHNKERKTNFNFLIIFLIAAIALPIFYQQRPKSNLDTNNEIARSPGFIYGDTRFLYNASFEDNGNCRPRLLVRIPHQEEDEFYDNGLDWARDIDQYTLLTVHVQNISNPVALVYKIKKNLNESPYDPQGIEYSWRKSSWAFEGIIKLSVPNGVLRDETVYNSITVYGQRSESSKPKQLYITQLTLPTDLGNIFQLPNSCLYNRFNN